MMNIKVDLLQFSIDFFYRRTSDGAAMLTNKYVVKNENMSNKELAEELLKPIIRKFKCTHLL